MSNSLWDLKFHKEPNEKSSTIILKNWSLELFTIEKCFGEWNYVMVKHDKRTHKGWIHADNLCANAYTTCN